jgi:energy-coupling factor transporter ATP-binding protein EcfA2
VKRITLKLAPGVKMEFTDRDRALAQVVEWAERGTRFPVVIFGPEGCGKTAFLRQAAAMLRELGYDAIYVDAAHLHFTAHTDVTDVVRGLIEAAAETSGVAQLKLANLAIDIVKELLDRWGRGKVAVLVDEAFQAVGLDKAGIYVKSLLNLIEYPPRSYERIIAVAATSEGLSRREIGRHRWGRLMMMWNMPREGFRQLYEKLPGPKPPFEEVWRWTGGNPSVLAVLYEYRWRWDDAVRAFIEQRGVAYIIRSLTPTERTWLEEAVGDPDTLFVRERMSLLNKLVEINVVAEVMGRYEYLWVDEPPPEKDPELSVGRYVAWQTPLHREAVRRALREAASS